MFHLFIGLKLSPVFLFRRFLAGEIGETIPFMEGHYHMHCLIIVLFEKNKIVVPKTTILLKKYNAKLHSVLFHTH